MGDYMKNAIIKIIKIALMVIVGLFLLLVALAACVGETEVPTSNNVNVSDTADVAIIDNEQQVKIEPKPIEYSRYYQDYIDKLEYKGGDFDSTDKTFVVCYINKLEDDGFFVEDFDGEDAFMPYDVYSEIPYYTGIYIAAYGSWEVDEYRSYQVTDYFGQIVEAGSVPVFKLKYVDRFGYDLYEETDLTTMKAVRDRICGNYNDILSGEALKLTADNTFVEGELIPDPLPDMPCYLISDIYYTADYTGPEIKFTITALNSGGVIANEATAHLYESPVYIDKQYHEKELDIETENFNASYLVYK